MSNFTIFLSTFLGTAAVTAFSIERVLLRLYVKYTETWNTIGSNYVKGDGIKREDGSTYVVVHVDPEKIIVIPTIKTIYTKWRYTS